MGTFLDSHDPWHEKDNKNRKKLNKNNPGNGECHKITQKIPHKSAIPNKQLTTKEIMELFQEPNKNEVNSPNSPQTQQNKAEVELKQREIALREMEATTERLRVTNHIALEQTKAKRKAEKEEMKREFRKFTSEMSQQNRRPNVILEVPLNEIRGQIQDIFDGSIPEQIIPCLQRFEKFIRIMGWTESESLASLIFCLPKNVISCLPQKLKDLTTYQEAKKVLQETYITNLIIHENLRKLMNVQQEKEESLEEYFDKVEAISHVAFCRGVDNSNVTPYAFCRGLREISLKQHTLRMQPETLIDAYNAAKAEAKILGYSESWEKKNILNQGNFLTVPGVGTLRPTTGRGRN